MERRISCKGTITLPSGGIMISTEVENPGAGTGKGEEKASGWTSGHGRYKKVVVGRPAASPLK